MIRALGEGNFHWKIPIDNIAILTNDAGPTQLQHRWTLEG